MLSSSQLAGSFQELPGASHEETCRPIKVKGDGYISYQFQSQISRAGRLHIFAYYTCPLVLVNPPSFFLSFFSFTMLRGRANSMGAGRCQMGFWSRFLTTGDQRPRKCPKCRQATVSEAFSETFFNSLCICSRRVWRCHDMDCAWLRACMCCRSQPPIAPTRTSTVKEVNPMHLVAESWHRPPSIIDKQPLTLPTIHLVD
ncbi:hypothetical protein EDD85DRAFT_868546 [Armillaria nabsnona]|nr:hypothetical protein EDD85DRAFT_868546 [Armillaria nabsnona]